MTKFREEFAEVARRACELGARDVDLANTLGVSIRTVHLWKSQHPAFHEALKVGKSVADDAVERSLYQRAVGYSHDAVKIQVVNGEIVETPFVEHFPPDTTAAIFWLKNRRPQSWRDKHEVQAEVAVKEQPDWSALSREERQVMRQLLLKAAPTPNL